MLEVTGATKTFGRQTVFEAFSLRVPAGGFTVLVGPSGCGKSTLFDGLTGVAGLDRGRLSWQGDPLPHLGAHAAYMQQKDLLLPWFTLMENSLLPARTGKRTGNLAAARTRAEALFGRLGLSGFETHYPGQVSGGMRQRCALVRTLMFNRDLILLDEPLSALDAITRQDLRTLLGLLQSEFGKTILMITHDIEEALVLGDEICLLGSGPMTITERFRPKTPKPRRFDRPELTKIRGHVLARLARETTHGTA